MAKQIRVTFNEKEMELYEYIKDKSSASAFLKDLAKREMLRDRNYINCFYKESVVVAPVAPHEELEEQDPEINLDFEIDDLEGE